MSEFATEDESLLGEEYDVVIEIPAKPEQDHQEDDLLP